MDPKIKTEIIGKIDILLSNKPVVIIAVDGRCGAGKTSLAAELGAHYKCNVFHLDDFYFTEEERALKEKGFANADLKRFENEVLKNIIRRAPFVYFKYLPGTGASAAVNVERPTRLTVVEGSYCTDISLEKYYDLKIFLTAGIGTRKKRLTARGEDIDEYLNKWMLYEENFFKMQDTEKRADMVINND